MKSLITAAAIALTTLTSFAQEATPAPEFDNFVSTRTRAEVRTELQAALASGWRPSQGEASYAPELQRTVSTRTRAEVRAELMAAIANGERLSYGEASPDPLHARNLKPSAASTVATRQAQVPR
jgi:hypothetical protein